jgi:RHH-type proline utilization regulon transcriptional repressor/proline dehydrogenase/delta 1-pyrroline-5-carboxylate dehydrogenase
MVTSRIGTSSLEAEIGRIGREVLQRATSAAPPFFSIDAWQQSAMNWLTAHEDLKLRLFRFIEVLPALQDSQAIVRHLDEYLNGDSPEALPEPLGWALRFRRYDSPYASLVAAGVRLASNLGAGQFIAGSTPAEAIASVRRLRRQGAAFTLDVLGETVIADHVARRHQALYIELVEHLTREARGWAEAPILDRSPDGPLRRVNISIKLSAIVARFDPIDPDGAISAVLERLRPILQAARECGAFINIDMEHYAVKDLTLEIYRRILTEPAFRDWPDCGIVIQAYLQEGEADMAALIAWARRRGTPITVRLVKGAYWDSETAAAVRNGWPIPVFTEKWQSDEAFERIARMMLENADVVRPAFASHNVRSIASALAMEARLGLPPRTLELQMLTGMGDALRRGLVAMGQRVRVYAPFGDLVTGMAYLIRRLLENTANESFLRQSFGQDLPPSVLLENPAQSKLRVQPDLPRPFIQDTDEYPDMEPFQNESDVDFSRPENREAMDAALASVTARFGRAYPAIVNHEAVGSNDWHASLDPSCPQKVVGSTAICDYATADRAVRAAQAAQALWAQTSADERAAVLDRAADILQDRRFEIAAWMIHEVGKTWREAQGDYMETVDYLRFYAREMRRLDARPRRRDYPGEMNRYVYSPRGVVLVLSPFCFPTALLTGMTAAALVTGNTVIVKPASEGSVCAAQIVNVLIEAGLPAGVLNFVPGRGDVIGAYLTAHPGVDMIAFTGSREVGCAVVEAGRRLHPDRAGFKHVLAEMGGKNAIIIDDDADLDEAVQATIISAFGYAGQKCTAASRAVVLDSVHDAYLDKLIEAAAAIKPAAACLPSTTVGPLISKAALDRAMRFVQIGRREGRCLLGGQPNENPSGGFFLSPTIFADVAADAHVAREESMAPILTVLRAESFARAIEIANATPYALAGGVYSRCPGNIEMAKHRLNVGMLYVNRRITLSRVDRQPFGGFNMSGLGTKTGGPDYLQQFTIPRTISENTTRHGFSPTNSPNRRRAAHDAGATPSVPSTG